MMRYLRQGAGAQRAAVLGIAIATLGGCDFLNPTRVTNPRTTQEDLAAAPRPTAALLAGLRAQFARALSAVVVTAEVTSDNYMIRATGISSELDDPHIIIPDVGVHNTTGLTGAYWNLQELQALASFALDLSASDPTATPALIAEAHFYRGMARLLQAENYVAVPTEVNGVAQEGPALLELATGDLNQALTLAGTGALALSARAALARAYRLLGDAAQAAAFANEVLAANAAFVHLQHYSAQEVANQPFTYTSFRGLREMQPLPRLDFLDPKYTSLSAPIPVLKAEEMHLILAEVALSQDALGSAADRIADAVQLALTRPREAFDDSDPRNNANLTFRPRHAFFLVRADATSPARAGLVLTRPGLIETPTISGTSLNPDSVRALAGAESIVHALYLARQEIFFNEGRRMSDLGIRLPMSRREMDSNPSLEESSPGAQARVPAYIPTGPRPPTGGGAMDQFTPNSPYSSPTDFTSAPVTTQITITVDMNRRLAQNYPSVSPF
jgi:tetratricopeptide (TPR) repeat protein